MDKRYQVFISSTFVDLEEERKKITQTLLEMDCIPVGMEAFPAIDQEQFDFIKTIIDDSDYYILIIGGRYGSVAPEGLSYTEMEYDYAIEKGKKVIAFLHGEMDALPLGKSEKVPESQEKLKAFREKVATGRMVKFWKNPDELPGMVSLSLTKTIRTYPATGWVRGDIATDPKVYQELNELRKENEILRSSLDKNQLDISDKKSDIAGLEESISVTGIAYEDPVYSNMNISWSSSISWKQVFQLIAPYLMTSPDDKSVKYLISRTCFSASSKFDNDLTPEIEDQDFQTIKIHLKHLGLIEFTRIPKPNGGIVLSWDLSTLGTEVMMNLRSVKKSTN